jgi:hypothetical protein
LPFARLSISRLMIAIAVIGFHLAVIWRDRPIFGLHGLELGLLPGVTVLAVMLFSGRRRRGTVGHSFVASLSAVLFLYIVCCLTTPDLVKRPVIYYINQIEPHLYDADHMLVYRLSLEIRGLVLGVPPLLFALAGATLLSSRKARSVGREMMTSQVFE